VLVALEELNSTAARKRSRPAARRRGKNWRRSRICLRWQATRRMHHVTLRVEIGTEGRTNLSGTDLDARSAVRRARRMDAPSNRTDTRSPPSGFENGGGQHEVFPVVRSPHHYPR